MIIGESKKDLISARISRDNCYKIYILSLSYSVFMLNSKIAGIIKLKQGSKFENIRRLQIFVGYYFFQTIEIMLPSCVHQIINGFAHHLNLAVII
jgi:hypothetical protein